MYLSIELEIRLMTEIEERISLIVRSRLRHHFSLFSSYRSAKICRCEKNEKLREKSQRERERERERIIIPTNTQEKIRSKTEQQREKGESDNFREKHYTSTS